MIAYRKIENNETLLGKNDKGEITGFHVLPQNKFITQADPFLFTYEGESWLFYEKQDLTDMKGTLWWVNLDVPGSKPGCILEEDFHLSYPQVFSYGKEIYMIPETRSAGDIRLYRCLEFPAKWEFAGKLFDLEAVDTTVLLDAHGRTDDRRVMAAAMYLHIRENIWRFMTASWNRIYFKSEIKKKFTLLRYQPQTVPGAVSSVWRGRMADSEFFARRRTVRITMDRSCLSTR